MYPELFSIGDISVSSFSVMALVSLLVGWIVASSEVKRKGLNPNISDFLLIACVIGGLGGAKVLFLFQNASLSGFINDPVRYMASGFTFFGGIIGSLILVCLVSLYYKISFWQLTDCLSPALILGQAFGRVGCLLVGDDYGIPSSLPWALSFPNGSPPTFERVHPTQIYESIAMVISFIIVWKLRKRDYPIGWISGLTLIILGVVRFPLEILRNTTPSFIPEMSQAQLISIILIIIGVVKLLSLKKRQLAQNI
ncbi:MAG: prolipoprotein diacylglyceryl transferase family protein [Thermodesulfobacteriota bacterium]